MLYHTIRHPGSSVYHGQCTAELEGALQEEVFKEAWRLAASTCVDGRLVLFFWERPKPHVGGYREAAAS